MVDERTKLPFVKWELGSNDSPLNIIIHEVEADKNKSIHYVN